MKKKLVLLGIMLFVALAGTLITLFINGGEKTEQKEGLTVVTSFYPVYIAALNVTEGVPDLELVNLTENQSGCLHDYQLTTKDMKKLETADVLIMNGGGMEGFMEDIIAAYPNLLLIDMGEGIEALEALENDEHEGHTHEETQNSHFWLNPAKYQKQIKNLCDGLSQVDVKHQSIYQSNLNHYKKEVEEIEEKLLHLDVGKLSNGVISFHDAFSYLAQAIKIPVIHSINLDADTSISAGETALIIEEIKEHNVNYLFAEKELAMDAPKTIARETDAKIIQLDSLVFGTFDKRAYIDGMEKNIEAIKNIMN